MCDPGILAALTIASGMAQMAQASGVARANQRHQEQVHEANSEAAAADAMRQYQALVDRENQEAEQTAQSIASVSREAAQAAGTARTAAGNTAGADVGVLLGDYARQSTLASSTAQRNFGFVRNELQSQAEGVRLGQQARELSTLPDPKVKTDFLGAALRIGSSAANTYYTAKLAQTQ